MVSCCNPRVSATSKCTQYGVRTYGYSAGSQTRRTPALIDTLYSVLRRTIGNPLLHIGPIICMPSTPYLSGPFVAEKAELDDASHGVAYP
ncbi:hypothetical protein V8F44DRAFT_613699 [Aspergillus fumigatus]